MKFNPGETRPQNGHLQRSGLQRQGDEYRRSQKGTDAASHTEQQMALRNRLSSMKKRRFAVFFHYSPFIVAFFSV